MERYVAKSGWYYTYQIVDEHPQEGEFPVCTTSEIPESILQDANFDDHLLTWYDAIE